MYFTTALALLGLFQAATAAAPACAADNCLRAARGKAIATRSPASHCSSYFKVTVTPVTTIHVISPTNIEVLVNQVTITASNIPAYAAAPCSGPVRYSSACSCAGATLVTTTIIPTPTCNLGQIVCSGDICQDVLSNDDNCGSCGKVCPPDKRCGNGQCTDAYI
ncbi:hypothetical protein BP5796_12649 [Coleophoma crateriformis]|uniref:Uncharacterized protein n=1 Tax=Coleophoma crateriformis TaxID=565419 RepID=A0A3D8Q5W2_9HELO|nr:hypothetical protein BP5796_12649 [Coleophoma crateriformis]